MRDARLRHARLRHARLRHARLRHARPRHARPRSARSVPHQFSVDRDRPNCAKRMRAQPPAAAAT
ncbi:pentapeptide repeat-containing protein [Burkholderia thailandensis]|uniref:pentapeptide repeat-containing protein n=1 Tax=Burkholderia thailandensis TaxID=57975 RepID=UPI00358DB7D2